ncbi:MAG: pentapeptide repeat-containing protein [Candidatus Thorarchaeota archaeon]|jgi:uncharacterized protein YjbI with pentapeptide repeats
MGECTYTWEEWDEEKQKYITKKCPEEIWKKNQDFCIFHDPSPEKDPRLFEKKLKKKLKNKDYNFQGYYFLENMDFTNKNFEKAAFFDGVTFQNVSFDNTSFDMVFFDKTTFNVASFDKTTFQNASFNGAVFTITSFDKATFQNASFEGAFFQDVTFNGAFFQDVIFNNATFQGASFEEAHFEQVASFRGANFQSNISFRGASFSQTYFIDIQATCYVKFENNKFCKFLANKKSQNALLEQGYRNIKNLLNLQGDYAAAGEFHYIEMEAKRCRTRNPSCLWLMLYKSLCGYGERPMRVIGASLVIILVGAMLFFFCGIEHFDESFYTTGKAHIIQYPFSISGIKSALLEDFGYCIYYSVITFTTLGYGDIHPLGLSHVFAAVESFIGAFFIALFVVVFARKMIR